MVRYEVFFFTMVVSVFTMLVLLVFGSSAHEYATEGTLLDTLTYYADPIFGHLLGVACVAITIWFGTAHLCTKRTRRLIFCFCMPCLAVLLLYIFGLVVLKPSFAYDRPAQHLNVPWLTAIVRADESSIRDSCPSGFVLRQMFLLMIGLVFYRGFRTNVKASQKGIGIERSSLMILLLLLIFVGFSRVYRGFHTAYDVAISISVSCYLFWLFYYLAGVFLSRLPRNMTSGIAAGSCIFVPIFLYYSQDAHWWALIGIGLFWVIGLTRMFANPEDNGGKTWHP
jgi:hypothetical protein